MDSNHNRNEPHWPFLTVALLGLWLMASPATSGYNGPIAHSDVITGAVMLFAGVGSLVAGGRHRRWARWIAVAGGFWLLVGPLVFETPHAAAYLNSTVVGAMLIALAIVIPRSLNGSQPVEPEVPPGWTYNPSSWVQRTPIIVLAFINFLLARYLAAYQLNHIDHAWDPVFGEGTHNVLTSDISEAFPISDAGLGAVAYMLEILIGCIGGASRWRTAPWAVALFGLLVVPVGVVSIILIMLQPVAVGDWCFICLVTAALMLVMALLAIPEVAALCWFLWQARRDRRPLWRTFFLGGPVEGGSMEQPPVSLTSPLREVFSTMVSGATAPWSLLLSVLAGAWLMATPAALGPEGPAADLHSIAGALVITASALAMAEPARTLRYVNLLLGLATIVSAFVLAGMALGPQINAVLLGLLVVALSIPRGRVKQNHGALQRLII